jgi:phosphoribosyl-AMP cyclohydrolase
MTDFQPAKGFEPQTADAVLAEVTWNNDGLVPAIAQDSKSGDVLMLAWMNEASITETLATGWVCYWSRSRQELWRKGKTSGHVQKLVDFRIDCDGDTILMRVEQIGPACHTGAADCFFRKSERGALKNEA